MTKNKPPIKPTKNPPTTSARSVQMDLFSQFLTNDVSEVSNTVEVWESIPKYFFTPKQVEKLRTVEGLAKPFRWEFEFNGQPCIVRIQPALIDLDDGSVKAFFPSVTEELVEEALKKILTDQRNAFHDPDKSETWIRFSLRMVQKELKNKGKTRSLDQIKHAIQVMSRCNLSLMLGKKEIWSGSILQDLVTVDREEYLADTEAHHIARLPLFVSHGINTLAYRQFNYNRLMSCKEQLTRWIYKRLINRFRQASMMTTYHFMYSDLKTSGLLQQQLEKSNRRKVIAGLDELVTKGVLKSYRVDDSKKGRKIIDVKYTVTPSTAFSSEQKASNKRQKDSETQALNSGISLVDNSR